MSTDTCYTKMSLCLLLTTLLSVPFIKRNRTALKFPTRTAWNTGVSSFCLRRSHFSLYFANICKNTVKICPYSIFKKSLTLCQITFTGLLLSNNWAYSVMKVSQSTATNALIVLVLDRALASSSLVDSLAQISSLYRTDSRCSHSRQTLTSSTDYGCACSESCTLEYLKAF